MLSIDAKTQQQVAEESQRLAEAETSKTSRLTTRLLGLGDSQTVRQQASDASAELQELREQLQGRKPPDIIYFSKPDDAVKVVQSLESYGYDVSIKEPRGSAPTNALWWGEGVEMQDFQFIAYTLISNGFTIRYIGKMSKDGQIQIGGRPASSESPVWTVEMVKSLTKLPEDNEQ
jgi:hypothetical protein